MGKGLIDLIQEKLELFRLEQRYTKRRNRRSTFVSEAQYVDGEYVYAPSSPSKRHSVVQFSESPSIESISTSSNSTKSAASSWGRGKWGKKAADKRQSMITVREVDYETERDNRAY